MKMCFITLRIYKQNDPRRNLSTEEVYTLHETTISTSKYITTISTSKYISTLSTKQQLVLRSTSQRLVLRSTSQRLVLQSTSPQLKVKQGNIYAFCQLSKEPVQTNNKYTPGQKPKSVGQNKTTVYKYHYPQNINSGFG